jgi:hypothetical protein
MVLPVSCMPSSGSHETGAAVGTRRRDADRGEHVARRQRGLEQILEEIVGRHVARTLRSGDGDLAAEREETCRQFGCRIGEGDRAADGAAIADRRMADMR